METLLIILVMALLLLLQGFFSGSEIALVHADKLKLQHRANKGHPGSKLLLKLYQKPEVLLGTTLVGTNLSVVALTTLGTLLIIRIVGEHGELVAFLLYTPLFLILGEVVPKSVYQQKADRLAPIVVYPLRFFSILFYPVVFVFSRLARLVANLVGAPSPTNTLFTKREQVRTVLEMTENVANVDVFDRDRLIRVVRFAECSAGDLMIPISDLTMVGHGTSSQQALRMARHHGHFRLPVYGANPADIIGAISLSIWDLMDKELAQQPLDKLIKPVLFVAPNQKADELLPILQARKDQMAIVVDEFGAGIGMLTLEDLIEEVAGEVINVGFNYEVHIPRHKYVVEQLDDHSLLLDGHMPINEVEEALNLQLPSNISHTIGGMIINQLRHIPVTGEELLLKNYRFTVAESDGRSIIKLRAERIS